MNQIDKFVLQNFINNNFNELGSELIHCKPIDYNENVIYLFFF